MPAVSVYLSDPAYRLVQQVTRDDEVGFSAAIGTLIKLGHTCRYRFHLDHTIPEVKPVDEARKEEHSDPA